MNKKTILIGFAILLILLGLAGTAISQSQLQTTNNSLELVHQEATQMAIKYTSAQAEITMLKATATALVEEKDKYQMDLAAATQRISSLQTQVQSLNNNVAQKQAELTTLQRFDCDRQPGFKLDYTSNASISESLKKWVGEIDGSVTSATWEVVWNNSTVSIHRIKAKYLWVYIVFFSNATENYDQAVFEVAGECFLDR